MTSRPSRSSRFQADLVRKLTACEAERDALAAWSCATCGARFPQSIRPALRAVLLDGVTQCSKCVEVEALAGRVQSLQAECEWLRAACESNAWYQRRGFVLETTERTKSGTEINVWRLSLTSLAALPSK